MNQRFGYRYGLIAGLFLFAVGALLFIPLLAMGSFHSFIGSLFLLACGTGFLETTANPYILQLGESDTAEKRLNLAQAFFWFGYFRRPRGERGLQAAAGAVPAVRVRQTRREQGERHSPRPHRRVLATTA